MLKYTSHWCPLSPTFACVLPYSFKYHIVSPSVGVRWSSPHWSTYLPTCCLLDWHGPVLSLLLGVQFMGGRAVAACVEWHTVVQ